MVRTMNDRSCRLTSQRAGHWRGRAPKMAKNKTRKSDENKNPKQGREPRKTNSKYRLPKDSGTRSATGMIYLTGTCFIHALQPRTLLRLCNFTAGLWLSFHLVDVRRRCGRSRPEPPCSDLAPFSTELAWIPVCSPPRDPAICDLLCQVPQQSAQAFRKHSRLTLPDEGYKIIGDIYINCFAGLH
ncbi:hypothetical protein ASPSYDRAFT_1111277 [Aspergillus sydowii CBS 593.65]|uniref:Uncharacterized protein n=1 Tax=Aspergillus sydowii CBS 593.65 TaxID=1036612 RepID=A0A1L9TC96_9EURO|nr:uncharacterized protein ASPSYDRAFT_1111277 [Aspergillus sydowii CBS 593.65]OJJ57031.1 hypothetical protein ASPSYDRAFT_1111277 [Aspergillus sydowii CBS 593.65]